MGNHTLRSFDSILHLEDKSLFIKICLKNQYNHHTIGDTAPHLLMSRSMWGTPGKDHGQKVRATGGWALALMFTSSLIFF